MGEAKRRRSRDPLYGIVPKTGTVSPLWVVHRGVLFLVGQGDSIACLPAGNMVTPNAEQLRVLEGILDSNPSLLNNTDRGERTVNSTSSDTVSTGIIDMGASYTPTNVTTINPPTVDLL